ncbi:MAG TPA: septum formation initiator family protein [Ktedonobacteraceae bacterium]
MNGRSTSGNGSRQTHRAPRATGGRWASNSHDRLTPLFLRLGPVALCLCSVLLISLMAILYLSQLGQVVATNQQIQDLRSQQAALLRENNDLVNTIAQEQSPAYIAARATKMGLVPADPHRVQVIIIQGSQGNREQP